MKENNKLFDYTLIFISILSIGYFILVTLNSRFITAYLTYPIFAFICISYGYFELKIKISLLSKLPLKLNYFIKIIFWGLWDSFWKDKDRREIEYVQDISNRRRWLHRQPFDRKISERGIRGKSLFLLQLF